MWERELVKNWLEMSDNENLEGDVNDYYNQYLASGGQLDVDEANPAPKRDEAGRRDCKYWIKVLGRHNSIY